MEKPLKCDFCDYRTSRRAELLNHIRHNHTMERPFKCDKCEMAFSSKKILVKHMVSAPFPLKFTKVLTRDWWTRVSASCPCPPFLKRPCPCPRLCPRSGSFSCPCSRPCPRFPKNVFSIVSCSNWMVYSRIRNYLIRLPKSVRLWSDPIGIWDCLRNWHPWSSFSKCNENFST